MFFNTSKRSLVLKTHYFRRFSQRKKVIASEMEYASKGAQK